MLPQTHEMAANRQQPGAGTEDLGDQGSHQA